MSRLDQTEGTTVLLVDDEPAIRELFGAALRNAGFTVQVAANGREAQAILRESPGSIGLLITDVEMPFVSGTELAASVAACGSCCPVLLMSGKAAPTEVDARGWEFLAKPFPLKVLIETAQRLLSRQAQRPRALLAEDDAEMRRFLCDLLGNEYNLVAILDGGASVVERSEALHPDVIVLDVSMPDVGGLAVARAPLVYAAHSSGFRYGAHKLRLRRCSFRHRRLRLRDKNSRLQRVGRCVTQSTRRRKVFVR